MNYPLLETVLAGPWQLCDRDRWTFWLAVVSIVVAGKPHQQRDPERRPVGGGEQIAGFDRKT